jgi:hypothetical protein
MLRVGRGRAPSFEQLAAPHVDVHGVCRKCTEWSDFLTTTTYRMPSCSGLPFAYMRGTVEAKI